MSKTYKLQDEGPCSQLIDDDPDHPILPLTQPKDQLPVVKEPLFEDGFLLHHVLSPSECQAYIDALEANQGWSDVKWDQIEPFRYCERIELINERLADLLWSRIAPHFDFTFDCHVEQPVAIGYVPLGSWKAQKLNPKFRICRYHPGGLFGPHTDGNYVQDLDHRSVYTFMIYLNGGLEGGTTDFLDEEAWNTSGEKKLAQPGTAICFYHNKLHEGTELLGGEKYIFRTDIVFERVDSTQFFSANATRKALEYLQLGEDMERSKQFEKAVKYYKEAYKLDPSLQNSAFGS